MELNGIANMLCIIDSALQDNKISKEVYDDLKDQLDVMERYMCAIQKANLQKVLAPLWHDVRDNRNGYPNNRGEFYDKKK